MLRKKAIVLPILIILFFTAACSKTIKQVKKNNPADKNKTVKKELVANFPTDFPLYPNAEVKASSYKLDTHGNMILLALWKITEPGNKVISFYQQKLPESSWQIIQKDAQMINFKRKDDPIPSKLRVLKTKKGKYVYLEAHILAQK